MKYATTLTTIGIPWMDAAPEWTFDVESTWNFSGESSCLFKAHL